MTGPVENDVDDEFLAMVRRGGLEDSPPEIAAEVTRLIRVIREACERYGVTKIADAPIEVQRAIRKEVKKPGPKRPELKPGQFERDLYLTLQVHKRYAEGEKIERAFEDVAGKMGEKVHAVRKRYYQLRKVRREWLEKEGRLEELEEQLENLRRERRERLEKLLEKLEKEGRLEELGEWQKKEIVMKRWEKYLTG